MQKIILASQSPRRKELLQKCGFSFEIDIANIDETIDDTLIIEDEIKRLALEKAETVLHRHSDAIVIGADTVICIQGNILGKPKTRDEAIFMLQKLSDCTHQVITGVAIVSHKHKYTNVIKSDVIFSKMSQEEIESYVNSKEPMDKAGAYAIQGIGSRFIQEIHGDYYAIVGLPINWVYNTMKFFKDIDNFE